MFIEFIEFVGLSSLMPGGNSGKNQAGKDANGFGIGNIPAKLAAGMPGGNKVGGKPGCGPPNPAGNPGGPMAPPVAAAWVTANCCACICC